MSHYELTNLLDKPIYRIIQNRRGIVVGQSWLIVAILEVFSWTDETNFLRVVPADVYLPNMSALEIRLNLYDYKLNKRRIKWGKQGYHYWLPQQNKFSVCLLKNKQRTSRKVNITALGTFLGCFMVKRRKDCSFRTVWTCQRRLWFEDRIVGDKCGRSLKRTWILKGINNTCGQDLRPLEVMKRE